MKTIFPILFISILVHNGCNAQQDKEQNNQKKKNQPEVRWKVDKQTDENGNIIRYDSTYVWSYTDTGGNASDIYVDSVMKSFHSFFDRQFPSLWQRHLGGPVWGDSLFYRDFFQPDYFFKRWENDFFRMDDMFRQMDSLRENFFRESYPGLIPVPQKNKREKEKTTDL